MTDDYWEHFGPCWPGTSAGENAVSIVLALTQFFADVSRWEADRSECALAVLTNSSAKPSRLLQALIARMHRRAQRAESALAKAERRIRYERQAYERMTAIVCEAWEALPESVRDEIENPMQLDGSIGRDVPDLVRGVKMLIGNIGRGRGHSAACVDSAIAWDRRDFLHDLAAHFATSLFDQETIGMMMKSHREGYEKGFADCRLEIEQAWKRANG